MNVLFVHQNFPGQYLHLARSLAAEPGHRFWLRARFDPAQETT